MTPSFPLFTRMTRLLAVGIFLLTQVLQPLPVVAAAPEPEASAPRPLADPVAAVSIPGQVVNLGEDFTLAVTFDNTGPDTGYGPFIDLIFPVNGADGAQNTDTPDGITFLSASYLGAPINPADLTVQTFPGSGPNQCVNHPLLVDEAGAPIVVCGDAGDVLVTIRLPFGSFVPEQPAAVVTVGARLSNLADLGSPLVVQARGGYQFGRTPLNDFCCGDAPNLYTSAWRPGAVTPALFTFTKSYQGPEDESATGPNFIRSYTLSAALAAGQTFSGFELIDDLPNNLAYQGGLSCSPGGYSVSEPAPGSPWNSPDNRLRVQWATPITGTSGGPEVTCRFNFFFPRLDANGAEVVPADSGDDRVSCNQGQAGGSWTPLDSRDTAQAVYRPETLEAGCASPEYRVTAKSIAIQKGVTVLTPPAAPLDLLRYTLEVQVSDYFAFNNLVVSDVLSDGQHFFSDATHLPQVSVQGNGFTSPATNIDASFYQVACAYSGTPGPECNTVVTPADGASTWTFNLSQYLQAANLDAGGRLVGGCVDPVNGSNPPDCGAYNDGGTRATITFYAQIQDQFRDDYPSGDPSVDQGDVLNDTVTVSGALLDGTTPAFAPNGQAEADGSAASLTIDSGSLTKSIYAVNGSTSFSSPVKVDPADTVTYRLTYSLPTSDVERLRLEDYLPLPVFQVSDPDATGGPGPAWTFSDVVSAAVPAAGVVKFGPSDTFRAYSGIVPTLTADAGANRLTFLYGDFDDPANTPTVVDLLFTVAVSSQPFADGLYLTNQAHGYEGTTNASDQSTDAIVQIQLGEPVLTSKKAVIWTDNPAATFSPALPGPVTFLAPGQSPRWNGIINSTNLAANPINSNLSGVDAGDLVSFAIYVENTGSSLSGAFDIAITDTLPAGFIVPPGGLNLQVHYGDSSLPAISYATNAAPGDCTGSADDPCGPDHLAGTPDDLFGAGIELIDPVAGLGICQHFDPNLGNNIILITYDLQVSPTAGAGTELVNTGTLTNYSGSEGGPDYANPDISDTARVGLANPLLAKELVSTSIVSASNGNTEVVIGEQARYRLTLTVPEGQLESAKVVDTLDSGLAYVSCYSASAPTPPLTTSLGDFSSVCSGAQVSANGATVTFDLGTLTNADTDNAAAHSVVIEYTAVALNVMGNQFESGTSLNNSAALTWADGSLPAVSAPEVFVMEPAVTVMKTVSPGSGLDAGDPLTYTITLSNTSGVDAFDVTLSDAIPALIVVNPASLTASGTGSAAFVSAADFNLTGNNLTTYTPFNLLISPASTVTLSVQGTIGLGVAPGQVIANTAQAQWTSLPGNPGQITPNNPNATERTGTGGVNDYAANGIRSFPVNTAQKTKYLVATSETFSASARVAVGEVARFRLVVTLPESTSANLQVQDLLPNGLTYLDDGTARAALVADTTISSAAVGSIPALSGCGVTGSVADATTPATLPCALADGNVGSSNSTTLDPDSFNPGSDPFFKFGTLVNNDSDANAEYVVVEFNALVHNASGANSNDTGENLNNSFQLIINSVTDPTPSNTVQLTVVEPLLTIGKTASITSPADAGATVSYPITITASTGANRATAFDITVTDTLNANLSNITVSGLSSTQPGGTCLGDGAGATVQTLNSTVVGQVVTITATCLDPGRTISAQINASVANTAPAGYTLPNTAALTYTSLPGTGTPGNPTGSNTPGGSGAANGERNGSGTAPNDLLGSSSANLNLTTPTFTKSTAAPGRYTIGETVAFYLLATLPEGTTRALVINDSLPAGLEIASYRVIRSAAQSGGRLSADFNGSFATDPPAETLVAGSGGSLSLSFGDVVTAGDNDPANNPFLVEVVARVLDLYPANADGAPKTNNSFLRYTHPANGATTLNSSANINLIEPRIATSKIITAPAGSVQAGDSVAYRVRFSNTGNSPAYNLTALDTLASGVRYNPGSAACSYFDGAATSPVGFEVTDQTTSLRFAGVAGSPWFLPATDPDAYIECNYTVTAQPALTLDGLHPNTIDADWRSLDAAGRLYDDTTPYPFDGSQDTAVAQFPSGAPALVKDDGGVTQVAIGDVITYTLTITSPLGTLRAAQVVDELPAGLIYVPGSQAVSAGITPGPGAAGFSLLGPTDGSGPVTLTWDFADAVVSASPVTITYQARVANTASNQNAVVLTNDVTLSYTDAADAPKSVSSSETSTVVEPVLAVTKTAAALAVTPDAGDTVTYTVTLAHPAGSTATAYNVHLLDTLPAVADLQIASLNVSGAGTALVENLSTDAANTVELRISDLPLGAVVTVTYQAVLTGAVTPGQLINNTAAVDWTSLPGTQPGERDGSGGLNDYAASATASLTTDESLSIVKSYVGASHSGPSGSVVIGETVTYAILVNLAEISYDALAITDGLPVGLRYESSQVVTTAAGSYGLLSADFAGSLPAASVSGGTASGESVVIAFGPTQVTGDNLPGNNAFVVLVTARVLNESGNQDGAVLTNTASLSVNGGGNLPGGSVDVTVREPQLGVDKSVSDDTPGFAQEVTFTILLTNPTATNAYDVRVADRLPDGLSYAAGSITAPGGWAADDSAAPALTWTGDLPAGGSATFTYRAVVNTPIPPGSTLSNIAIVTWTSLPGDEAEERDGSGGLDDYLVSDRQDLGYSTIDLSLAKSDAPDPVQPGADLTYILAYANTGNQAANGVTLTETIPAYATYSPANTEAWNCSAFEAGGVCTLSLGTLAENSNGTATFIVRVNSPLPQGVEGLTNTASIDDSDTTTTDPTPADNSDTEPTTVNAAPNLVVTKDDGLTIVAPGATLTYTLVITNAGDQTATGVTLTDTISPETTFVSASDGGMYDEATGVITWPAFDLPAEAGANTRTVTVVVTVNDTTTADSLTNTARVTDDGSNSGGNPVSSEASDTDSLADSSVKSLVETDQAGSANPHALIGEILTYEIRLDVPTGTMLNLQALDVLDHGLAFVDCLEIEAGTLATDLAGGFADACNAPTNPTVTAEPAGSAVPADAGRRVTFNLGNVSNNSQELQTLTIRYQAIVLDIVDNVSGTSGLNNIVRFTWSGGELGGAAQSVDVIEPKLAVTKVVKPTSVVSGGTVTFTLEIAHTAESTAPAYDVTLTDVLPEGLTYLPGTLAITSGPAGGVTDASATPRLTVTWPAFGLDDRAVVTFQATYRGPKDAVNSVSVDWSSLPGAPGLGSAFNPGSSEREYAPSDNAANNYRAQASATVREPDELPATGFAPGVRTAVPQQPAAESYTPLAGMWLEIPALKLELPIAGIPINRAGAWDLTWLKDELGYLQGTTYPGQVGVTGLTGHVYQADGSPGPFVNLGQLSWGQPVILHAAGLRYVFEVREARTVLPNDLSVLKPDGYTWLALMTCKGYNEQDGSYAARTVVRAVLLRVESE